MLILFYCDFPPWFSFISFILSLNVIFYKFLFFKIYLFSFYVYECLPALRQ